MTIYGVNLAFQFRIRWDVYPVESEIIQLGRKALLKQQAFEPLKRVQQTQVSSQSS